MKRWCSHLFIVSYIGVLLYGLVVHTIGFNPHANIYLYFVVWDMFCGWDTFEVRHHLIGEGESGEYYDLSPPWKELNPYGGDKRHHYDDKAIYSGYIATNTLRHTRHEPIVRIIQVDEAWSKKYNLPEALWRKRFDEERQPISYNYIRAFYDPTDGRCLRRHYGWSNHLAYRALMDNPRLREDVARGQPYMRPEMLSGSNSNIIQPAAYYPQATRP